MGHGGFMRKRLFGVHGLLIDITMKSIYFINKRSIGKCSLVVALFYSLILWIFFQPFAYAATYEASSRPWSGYWWPYTQGGLGTGLDYRGRPAPLEKYNLLTTGSTSGTALAGAL
jgi:hypothetical protein